MTVWMGVALWILALSAFAFALWNGWEERLTHGGVGIRLLLIILAAVFLFRPEEEIKTGDDPAAYFLMAQTFARSGRMVFNDPALLALEPAERPLFRYGTERFGLTKDHCFWIKDVQEATVGPWFQPAFPLMMSVPVWLAGPGSALYVTPLFGILAALLLASAVGRMIGSRWMPLTFTLFVLHPAIAWNARCVRPELVALCLLLSGIMPALLLPDRGRRHLVAGWVGGLAAAVSVLLHMTAFYVLIPALLLAAWNTRLSRFWAGWWGGVLAGLALLAAQLVFVGDPYGIGPSLMLPSRRLLFSALLLMCACLWFGLLGRGRLPRRGLGWLAGRMPGGACWLSGEGGGRVAGAMAGILFILTVIWIYSWRDAAGRVPGLPNWVNAYLSLSDFQGVASVASRTWAMGALAGVVWFCLGQSRWHVHGLRLLLLFGPASLLAGWMHIYMFETRRMVIAVAPLMVVSLVALVHAGAEALGWAAGRLPRRYAIGGVGDRRWLALWQAAAFAVLAAVAVRGREPLYSLWNRRGTLAFFEQVAQQVRENGDFLLAEYTQTAAPLAHLTGLPLLPLASDYRTDAEYRQAEMALARIVRQNPGRRHLLVTPFASAALPGVSLEYLGGTRMHTRLLERSSRRQVPDKVLDNQLTLHLYRVGAGTGGQTPFIRQVDGSRLGIRGGARRFADRAIQDRGLHLKADVPRSVSVSLPAVRAQTLALFFWMTPDGEGIGTDRISVTWLENTLETRESSLGAGWRLLDIRIPADHQGDVFELALRADVNAFLTDGFVSDADGFRPVDLGVNTEWADFATETMDFQWLRADASLALPAPVGAGRVWLYASGGRNERAPAALSLHGRDGAATPDGSTRLEQEWSWHLLPYRRNPDTAPGVFDWYDLRTVPAWNPRQQGYPDDLGLLVATVVADDGGLSFDCPRPIFTDE